MSLRNWECRRLAWFIFCLPLCVCVCVRSSVYSCSSYGLWSSRPVDERGALHCSISRQPQTITKFCPPAVSLLPPLHTAASLFSPVPHWAVAFPAHCLCRRDGTIKQGNASFGSGWLWMHMGLRGVSGGKWSEPNPVMHVSQMEAGHRGNWSAAKVAGTQTTGWGLPLSPSLDLIGFLRKCLFLSLPRWEGALTYLITIY